MGRRAFEEMSEVLLICALGSVLGVQNLVGTRAHDTHGQFLNMKDLHNDNVSHKLILPIPFACIARPLLNINGIIRMIVGKDVQMRPRAWSCKMARHYHGKKLIDNRTTLTRHK